MLDAQENIGQELQNIYIVLRKLQDVQDNLWSNKQIHVQNQPLGVSSFGRNFIYKFLNEILSAMDRQALRLAGKLIERIVNKSRQACLNRTQKLQPEFVEINPVEFDEYFHLCLFHLYDRVCELNWHEVRDVCDLPEIESLSVKANLLHTRGFIIFQATLYSKTSQLRQEKRQNPTSAAQSQPSSPILRQHKSNLSSSATTSSLSGKKRVRFDTSMTSQSADSPGRRGIEETGYRHILALSVTMYGLSLFLERFVKSLITRSQIDSVKLYERIRGGKQRFKHNQLQTLQARLMCINVSYMQALSLMDVVRRNYLTDRLLNVVCARSSSQMLRHKMRPLIRALDLTQIVRGETQLISSLSALWLQVVVDLIVNDINLPPSELDAETASLSRDDVKRSRENQTDFISSLLNLNTSGRKEKRSMLISDKEVANRNLAKTSIVHSSSRILAHTDSLCELFRFLMNDTTCFLKSPDQVEYFIKFTSKGIIRVFELITVQLQAQIDQLHAVTASSTELDGTFKGIKALARNIDQVAIKVRCLKCNSIFAAIERCLKNICERAKMVLPLNDELEVRIAKFASQLSVSE